MPPVLDQGDQPTPVNRVPTLVAEVRPGAPLPGSPALPEASGRYRILRKLGQGAMGTVYLAHDAELDRQITLKVPRCTAAEGSEILERFHLVLGRLHLDRQPANPGKADRYQARDRILVWCSQSVTACRSGLPSRTSKLRGPARQAGPTGGNPSAPV